MNVIVGGPDPGFCDVPANSQNDGPAHDTEENQFPNVPGPAAAVTSDQPLLLHSSTSGFGSGVGPCCPAARQKEGLTHEIALNWAVAPFRSTEGFVVVQLDPSQNSSSVDGLNPAMVIVPTATQKVLLTHETPLN
jgi:hypothetical protein